MKQKILPGLMAVFYFFSLNTQQKLHICTVASSEKNSGYKALKKSCQFNKLKLTTLGINKPYENNRSKIIYMNEFIKKIPDNDIILFIDAYDVILLANKKTIIKKFLKFNKPFIIGVEKNAWPDCYKHYNKYPKSKTDFCYINTGCYIGYAKAIKKILNDLMNMISGNELFCLSTSDQILFHDHFLKNQELYCLDYNCDLFLNLFNVEKHNMNLNDKKKTILFNPTHSNPIAVHGNGNKKMIQELHKKFYKIKN